MQYAVVPYRTLLYFVVRCNTLWFVVVHTFSLGCEAKRYKSMCFLLLVSPKLQKQLFPLAPTTICPMPPLGMSFHNPGNPPASPPNKNTCFQQMSGRRRQAWIRTHCFKQKVFSPKCGAARGKPGPGHTALNKCIASCEITIGDL